MDRRVPSTGSAVETWATVPSPKKLRALSPLVQSTNWSTRTNVEGGRSSRREPTAERATT